MPTMTMEEAIMRVTTILAENGWTVKKTGPAVIFATRDDGQRAVFHIEVVTGEPKIKKGEEGRPDSIILPNDPNFVGIEVQTDLLDDDGEVFGSYDPIQLDGSFFQAQFVESLHARP